MFNREQFLMTGVVFFFLTGTFVLLSATTVLRNQKIYRDQVGNINDIRQHINIDRVAIESNNRNSTEEEGNNNGQSAIIYSADFNNMVNIRKESEPLNTIILSEKEIRKRERSRLDELRARNEKRVNETRTSNSERVDEEGQAILEKVRDFPCINVWNNLEQEEITHSICIELYRDNGDNLSNYDKDTLVGFTLVTDHITEYTDDYYEFNNLPSGRYFAKFYHLGHEAPVIKAIQTSSNSDTDVHYNSWETAQIEATPVDAGYCVRFDRKENKENFEELKGISVAPAWENH